MRETRKSRETGIDVLGIVSPTCRIHYKKDQSFFRLHVRPCFVHICIYMCRCLCAVFIPTLSKYVYGQKVAQQSSKYSPQATILKYLILKVHFKVFRERKDIKKDI